MIGWRFAGGHADKLLPLAKDLVQVRVDVIVTAGTPATAAARSVTRTVPIVMASASDPIRAGFAASFARPGGNITGFSMVSGDIGGKQLELLLTVLGPVAKIGVLLNPESRGDLTYLEEIRRSGFERK